MAKGKNTRGRNTVDILTERGEPKVGTLVRFRPSGVKPDKQKQILDWISRDPIRGQAIWTGDNTQPLERVMTGERGNFTSVGQQIIIEALGAPEKITGPKCWMIEMTLAEYASRPHI